MSKFWDISRFLPKNGEKSNFSLKLTPFWVIKSKKLKISKIPNVKSFIYWGTSIWPILGSIWPFLKKKIDFSCFSRFLVKIATFLEISPPTTQKKFFWGNFFFYAKFCGIEPTYTKFQVIPTKNIHFIDIQSFHRDPKFKPPEAIFPYVLIQNSENTKMGAKSRKMNIFAQIKKQSSSFFMLIQISKKK